MRKIILLKIVIVYSQEFLLDLRAKLILLFVLSSEIIRNVHKSKEVIRLSQLIV